MEAQSFGNNNNQILPLPREADREELEGVV